MRCAWKPEVEAFYDWQGGLIWLRIDGEPESEAVRRLVKSSWRRPRDAGPCIAHPARGDTGVRTAVGGARRALGALERSILSARPTQPGADGLMQTNFTLAQLADPHVAESEKFCAPASIAASARRHARPMCCSATSSIQPARPHLPDQGHAGERQAGRRPRSSPISTAASPASPA